ncbi:hypothetical protein [Bacillus rhizoplanae]|uniref:hypothetical protein n=1 Tax=Bacillus rhizoplanae TaxID=2880966 RepID=UPI003D249D1D
MSALKYEFKEASAERKAQMLSDIISNYNTAKKNERIQALGHAQAVLDCTQDEFASHADVAISTRMLRVHKKELLDVYTMAFEKFSTSPQLKEVDGDIEESALEEVYQNLLARLKSPKTSTKDLAIILEYFGVTKDEFKQFADFRNATMRGFLSDNLAQIVAENDKELLIKSVIAESPYLYQGTEKTAGNTYNAQTMDLDNPIVRLEVQTLGLLFVSLFNGKATEHFVNHAETLRLLKLASGAKTAKEMEKTYKDFDKMDGKQTNQKPLTPKMEQELISAFGAEGKEMFEMMVDLSKQADKKTAVTMPKYEDVAPDYEAHLKAYPELDSMPFRVMLAKLDAKQDKQFKEKYQQFLDVNEN